MIVEDLDDVRWDLDDDGREVRRDLDRRVLVQHDRWATTVYLYDALDPRTEEWHRKLTLVRWHRVRDGWKKQASFNLTDREQAAMLRDALSAWFPPSA